MTSAPPSQKSLNFEKPKKLQSVRFFSPLNVFVSPPLPPDPIFMSGGEGVETLLVDDAAGVGTEETGTFTDIFFCFKNIFLIFLSDKTGHKSLEYIF